MKYLNALLTLTFTLTISMSLFGQEGMEYYLPEGTYDPNIPTPMDVLGYNPGDWHVSHDQLVTYMKAVDAASDRIEMREYARSHENRPLFILIVSDPSNLTRLEDIRKDHLLLTDPDQDNVDITNLPAILYQGYSIHGNESSGANAAIVNAYYLAAGQHSEVMHTLKNTVILLDPCYNPDGFNRFASWTNTHKSKTLVSDPASRELNEVWPRGRTNHYWFDLNRDWLLLTHPESQGRIKVFHQWRPNVLTDHHEMGTNSTFFFQPGIPSRTNPNTPQLNQDLTEKIGLFHAAALDSIGSLYYTKASFDDYYYGKGSTYPDANGCIGILFEQASSRGHLQESANGLLSFPFTIRNQFVTSLSTQKATATMREELINFKRDFYQKQRKAASNSKIKGYVFTDKDIVKLSNFHRILNTHQVDIYRLSQDVSANGKQFKKDDSYYVPMDQNQYLMVKTIFEKVRDFPDSLFYDVSAWTLPLAFDLTYAEVTNSIKYGNKVESMQPMGTLDKIKNPYAYILDWKSYNAPTAIYQVMKNDLRTKVINKAFSLQTGAGEHRFMPGDVVIPLQNQSLSIEEIENLLLDIVENYHVDFFGVSSGWASDNMTLGNPAVDKLDMPSVAMIVGEGVTSYDAGEVWHHLDQRYHIPLTMIDKRQLYRADMSRYTTLIMVNGQYRDLRKSELEKLKDWVKDGGNLILFRNAVGWASDQEIINLERTKNSKSKSKGAVRKSMYFQSSAYRGATVLGGAIFEAEMDLSHPLCYGYDDDTISLFRRSTTLYEAPSNLFSSPVNYTNNPVLSGYIPREFDKKAAGKPAITVHQSGSGKVVCFQDNLLFRGYWYGGNKLFGNAIFFSDIIDGRTTARE
ncbi:MAG: M14 family metallopeptidase [Bacteroidota bacterium]